jgi:hypothetical protein
LLISEEPELTWYTVSGPISPDMAVFFPILQTLRIRQQAFQ